MLKHAPAPDRRSHSGKDAVGPGTGTNADTAGRIDGDPAQASDESEAQRELTVRIFSSIYC